MTFPPPAALEVPWVLGVLLSLLHATETPMCSALQGTQSE